MRGRGAEQTNPEFFFRRIRGFEFLPLFLDLFLRVGEVPNNESGIKPDQTEED